MGTSIITARGNGNKKPKKKNKKRSEKERERVRESEKRGGDRKENTILRSAYRVK